MDELLTRHRKEKHDLQAKIIQKKKNATKKTRKGVNDECERLERELAERQQAEIQGLNPTDPTQLTEAVEDLTIDESAEEVDGEAEANAKDIKGEEVADSASSEQPRNKRPNRQKARLARRAAEQEAQVAAAAQEAETLPDLREQELSAMKEQMTKLGLSETLIRPDGHCLFSACAHSMPSGLVLKSGPNKEPYQNVRHAAAEFMVKHPQDFEAFMEEPLDSYVKKIRDTAEWGGQLELQAIARSYHVDINVLQANGRVEKISSLSEPGSKGDSSEEKAIWLAYYQHSFGLGEHYNALREVDKT